MAIPFLLPLLGLAVGGATVGMMGAQLKQGNDQAEQAAKMQEKQRDSLLYQQATNLSFQTARESTEFAKVLREAVQAGEPSGGDDY